jgi:membrane-associated phospholipid phosphatase
VLAAVDQRQFGQLALHWRGAFGRPAAFTDVVYGAYASFYFLPIAVAVLTRLRLGPERFERVAFTLLLGFYLSFLGYFLWPAEGPRVPQALESAQLGGGLVSEAIRVFLRGAETTTLDAFPSGHTALSLLPAILASRLFPRLAPLLWIWALAIVFATVYISAHYVVDVLAGLVLAGLTLALAPPLSRLLGAPQATTPPSR